MPRKRASRTKLPKGNKKPRKKLSMKIEYRYAEYTRNSVIVHSLFWIFEKGYSVHEAALKRAILNPSVLATAYACHKVTNPNLTFHTDCDCKIIYPVSIHPVMGEEVP
jgi:hypothetical protein